VRTTIRLAAATVVVLAVAAVLARHAGERRAVRRSSSARPIQVLPPDSAIAGRVVLERPVAGYLIRLLLDTASGDRIAEIQLNGRRVYAVRAPDVRLEQVGKDLTGDQVPDVVIQQFSGGMHCCTQATVLGLGRTLQNLGTIDGADGDVTFEDVDGDGRSEVKIGDWRFAYWRDYPFSETEVPDVILRFRDGVWVPACDLMRQDPPTEREIRAKARQLASGWSSGDPPPDLYGYAVDLVYEGNPGLAWRFLDIAWPMSIAGKAEFVRDLREKLRGSPCWSPPPSDTRPKA
jgi:hypothetical protein